MCEHGYHHPLPENWDGMGWDGESGVTMSLGLVWSSVAPGAGKTPPQGEPKGQTNWSPCWALLWAKSCWFEELPDPGAFTDGHQQRHLVSLPLSLLPRHHPSPWQAENILSPLHSTPPPLVTDKPRASRVCLWSAGRMRMDMRPLPTLGASAVRPLLWPSLLWEA